MWRPFLLAAALASAGLPIYVHLPRHASADLALSLSIVAAVLLGLRLIDFAQDPLLGRIIDRHPNARPYFAVLGAGGMAIGHIAVFSLAPVPTPIPYLAVSLLLLVSGFSLLSILFYSRSTAIAGGAAALPRLAAWREAGGLAGLIFATLLPDILMIGLPRSEAYAAFGLLLAAISAAACWAAMPLWQIGANVETGSERTPTPSFRVLREAGCLQLLFLAFLNALPVAFTSTLFLFFAEDRLSLPGGPGLYLAAFFCSAALSAPFWGKMMARRGPRFALLASMVLAICSFCGAALLPEGAALGFTAICVASGFAVGGDLVVLPAWFALRLNKSGLEAGGAFGLWSAAGKLALAVGAALALPALDAVGFTAGEQNSPRALGWLTFLYAILPCSLKLAALGLLFRITEREEWK